MKKDHSTCFSAVLSILYFSQENFTNQKHSITTFEKCLSKSNKNKLILLSQYIKCSNVLLSLY